MIRGAKSSRKRQLVYVEQQVTVLDLVRRIDGRVLYMNKTNPERKILEECKAALISVSVQLAETKESLDTVIRNFPAPPVPEVPEMPMSHARGGETLTDGQEA